MVNRTVSVFTFSLSWPDDDCLAITEGPELVTNVTYGTFRIRPLIAALMLF